MLERPAATVTASPTYGFSAAMKKLWNMFCSTENGNAASRTRPYSRERSRSCPSAPKKPNSGSSANAPTAHNTTLSAAAANAMNVNRRFARTSSPSPMVLATSAAPPVPNMKPMEPRAMANGYTRFTAASASLPVKLDTNRPSTML